MSILASNPSACVGRVLLLWLVDGYWFSWVKVLGHYIRGGRFSHSLVCVLLPYISFKMGTNHIAFYFLLEMFPGILQFGIADLEVDLLLLVAFFY